MSDSPELEKRRRDLYAISIGLIVFNVAGGALKSESTQLFGAITITRPLILLLGAWLVWGYFLWQFWLIGRPFLSKLKSDVEAELQSSSEYRQFCRYFIASIASMAKQELAGKQDHGIGLFADDMLSRIRRHIHSPFKPQARLVFRIFEYSDDFIVTSAAVPDATYPDKVFRVPYTVVGAILRPFSENSRRFDFSRAWFRAVLSATIKREEVSNRVLPMLVAIVAPIIQIARVVTQLIRHL